MQKTNRLKNFVVQQNFIKELNIREHLILWLGCLVCLACFVAQVILFKSAIKNWVTWFTLISSIFSIMFIFAGSKKRIICPILGLIGAVFLMAVSWQKHLYGFVIMQACNIITQTVTLITWSRSSANKITIEPREMKLWISIIYVLFFIGLAFIFAWVESLEGFYGFWSGWTQKEPKPYVIRLFESLSLMFIVAGFYPMIRGYTIIWWMYAAGDITMAITWVLTALTLFGSGLTPDVFNCWSTFTSNICMLISCFVPIYNWWTVKQDKIKKR